MAQKNCFATDDDNEDWHSQMGPGADNCSDFSRVLGVTRQTSYGLGAMT
jgi:hypothetical protein